MRKMNAYDVFCQFIKENGRYPTLEEWLNIGYSRATYYRCKKDYQPTEPEEYGFYERTNVEQYPNGITFINLKLKGANNNE